MNYVIPKSYFSEPENEPINYAFETNETSKDSWLSMSENLTHLTFSGTPSNTQFGTFRVKLMLTDNQTDTGQTNNRFNI